MLRKKTTLTKRLNEGLKAADEVTRVREQQPARRESETMNVVITRSDVLREMQQFHQQYLSRINTIVGMALDDTRALGGVGLTDDALAGGGHGTSGEGVGAAALRSETEAIVDLWSGCRVRACGTGPKVLTSARGGHRRSLASVVAAATHGTNHDRKNVASLLFDMVPEKCDLDRANEAALAASLLAASTQKPEKEVVEKTKTLDEQLREMFEANGDHIERVQDPEHMFHHFLANKGTDHHNVDELDYFKSERHQLMFQTGLACKKLIANLKKSRFEQARRRSAAKKIPDFNGLFLSMKMVPGELQKPDSAVTCTVMYSVATPENEQILKGVEAGDDLVKRCMKERAITLWEQLLYKGDGVEDEGLCFYLLHKIIKAHVSLRRWEDAIPLLERERKMVVANSRLLQSGVELRVVHELATCRAQLGGAAVATNIDDLGKSDGGDVGSDGHANGTGGDGVDEEATAHQNAAVELFQTEIVQAKAADDHEGELKGNYGLALALRRLGRFEEGLKALKASALLAQASSDTSRLAEIHGEMAAVHMALGLGMAAYVSQDDEVSGSGTSAGVTAGAGRAGGGPGTAKSAATANGAGGAGLASGGNAAPRVGVPTFTTEVPEPAISRHWLTREEQARHLSMASASLHQRTAQASSQHREERTSMTLAEQLCRSMRAEARVLSIRHTRAREDQRMSLPEHRVDPRDEVQILRKHLKLAERYDLKTERVVGLGLLGEAMIYERMGWELNQLPAYTVLLPQWGTPEYHALLGSGLLKRCGTYTTTKTTHSTGGYDVTNKAKAAARAESAETAAAAVLAAAEAVEAAAAIMSGVSTVATAQEATVCRQAAAHFQKMHDVARQMKSARHQMLSHQVRGRGVYGCCCNAVNLS